MPAFNKAAKTNYPALMNRPFSPDTPYLQTFAFQGLAKKKGRCRPFKPMRGDHPLASALVPLRVCNRIRRP